MVKSVVQMGSDPANRIILFVSILVLLHLTFIFILPMSTTHKGYYLSLFYIRVESILINSSKLVKSLQKLITARLYVVACIPGCVRTHVRYNNGFDLVEYICGAIA